MSTVAMNSRKFRGLVALVAVLVFGGYFVFDEWRIRQEAWHGTVEERWTKERRKWSFSDSPGKRRLTYHFWRVALQDGEKLEVKVPASLYNRSAIGSRVTKRPRERYPVIDP